MTETTPIDAAHAAMVAAPEDGAARLAFYERLAGSELFLLLSEAAEGEDISPEIFEVEGQSFALVFDREARLSAFSGQISPYAALSGRTLVPLLADQCIGLGVNLEIAPSSILIPPDGVAWLANTLQKAPEEREETPQSFHKPSGLPELLLNALDSKLATALGLAEAAFLVGVTYQSGAKGHLLGFLNTAEGAEPALAQAASEALIFSGLEAGALDVSFLNGDHPFAGEVARVGLRFDLPQLQEPIARAAPGSDPEKPPKLR